MEPNSTLSSSSTSPPSPLKMASSSMPPGPSPSSPSPSSPSSSIITTDSPLFQELLTRASNTDFDYIEKTHCIGIGYDPDGVDTIYIIPALALTHLPTNFTQSQVIELMILYFIQLTTNLVHHPFNIVYCHSNFTFLQQFHTLTSLNSTLPRRYKKNLLHLYILHPTTRTKFFTSIAKIFFGKNVDKKLQYISCIAELQSIISPLTLPLPSSFLLWEDTVYFKRTVDEMLPLVELYDDSLGAPLLMVQCLDFLRQYGLHSEGLFRVAGDQIIFEVAKVRILRNGGSNVIICPPIQRLDSNGSLTPPLGSGTSSREEIMEEYKIDRQNTINSQRSIGQGIPLREMPDLPPKSSFRQRANGFNRKNMFPMADVLLHDVHEVAQLLKSFLRSLPEPVITSAAYRALLEASKISHANPEDSLSVIEHILADSSLMPEAHIRTFEYLMSFLATLARESHINKMTPDNISVVFAPTLMKMEVSDPMQALHEIKISQKILKAVLLNRMEKHLSTQFLSNRLSGGMNTRLGRVVRDE